MAGMLHHRHWQYWLAAILDGEGSVLVDRRIWPGTGLPYYTLSIQVKNTHRGLLEQVRSVAGVGSIRHSLTRPGQRPVYIWSAHGPSAATVLRALERVLIVKRQRAKLALDLQATKLKLGQHRPPEVAAYQASLFEEIKRLNRRGALPADTPPRADSASAESNEFVATI